MSLSSARFRGNPRLEAVALGDVAMYLRINDQGDAVREVQGALIDYGPAYNIPDGPTGYFGPQTAAAVTAFKRNHNLIPSDPVVGIQTITTLDNHFASPYADRREWLEQFKRPFRHLNFNRFKERLRRQLGASFTFNPSGVQLPGQMRAAFLAGLEGLLDPAGSPDGAFTPSATWGVSPLDTYHVHLSVDEPADGGWAALQWQFANGIRPARENLVREADRTGAVTYSSMWTAHYHNLLHGPADASGNTLNSLISQWLSRLLAETSPGRTLRFTWHTFESKKWRPEGMLWEDPRRHWRNDIAPTLGAVTHATPLGWTDLGQLGFLIDDSFQITIAGTTALEATALLGVAMEDVHAAER